MLTATGDEAAKLARAVSSAKRDNLPYKATFSWSLQFYRGTNLLDVLRFQQSLVIIDGKVHNDGSGVLDAFNDKVLADR